MTHRLSTAGYLYAIQALAQHWLAHGIKGGPDDPYVRQLLAVSADGSPRDDARALLTAAEALVEAADDRSADLRNNDGDIICALDFDTAREFLETDG